MPRALIVDDNPENRYLLQCLLSANGFEVISASNGREALDRAESLVPDLVLSDILMPVMDGFSLCREWKQSARLKTVPFVFYTATYTDPQDEQFARSLGADLFVVKPAEPNELIRVVHGLLDKHSQGELPPQSSTITNEAPYLRQYNEVLIRKLEDKLLQVERANQHLLIKDYAIASSKSGIAMADLTGRINYTNDSFVRLWRREDEEIMGQGLERLFSRNEQWAAVSEQLQRSRYWSGQLLGRGRASGDFVAQTEIHTVCDTQGVPLCLMVVCSDITEQERMRQELQRAQRMESLSQFAAGIAHDFNNLLTAIFAVLDLSNPASAEVLDPTLRASIIGAFQRAREMTRRLLNFGKGTAAPRRVVPIRPIVEESCRLSLAGSSTRLDIECREPLCEVHANATELGEVFGNIALNARQAMQDSGELRVSITNQTVGDADATSLGPGEYVSIEFKDSGPGIDAATQQRIFEPFFTSKPEGSGLGLAMSRAIVNSYGGQIELSSSLGTGTTFRVWLPATAQLTKVASATPVPLPDRVAGRILVLDDDETIGRIMSCQLQKQGYEVQVATDGARAIELHRQARTDGQAFDLLIFDLTVSNGLGGAAALAVLRGESPGIVALACSGRADEATAAEVKAQGFVGLLAKPFLAHELASLVSAVIARRP